MRSVPHWILEYWLTQEKFWVAFSAVVTMFALVYTITWNIRMARREKGNLKFGLFTETFMNVNHIFSGTVDQPLLFDAINALQTKHVGEVKDTGVLAQWQTFYVQLKHYERFVSKVYLTNSGIDRRFVTERQLVVCNTLLEHFREKPISYDIAKLQSRTGNDYIEKRRDLAISIQKKQIEKWSEQISSEIDKML